MNEQELWQKFLDGGRVVDYLEYKSFVGDADKMRSEESVKNNGTGIGDKRTEHR